MTSLPLSFPPLATSAPRPAAPGWPLPCPSACCTAALSAAACSPGPLSSDVSTVMLW